MDREILDTIFNNEETSPKTMLKKFRELKYQLQDYVVKNAVQGPEGPQGPQGPQGPEGPQGPKGEKGDSVDLDNYYTKTEIDAMIGDTPNLDDYYTKTEIDTMIGDIESILDDILGVEKLSTPQNVTADGTTVSWDEVENATSYEIFANGVSIGEVGI